MSYVQLNDLMIDDSSEFLELDWILGIPMISYFSVNSYISG